MMEQAAQIPLSAMADEAEERSRNFRTRKMLTYLIVFAIVMFFAGLTSAYVVSMSGGYWVDIALPEAFLYSTIFILVSSGLAQLALWDVRKEGGKAPLLLLATLFFGMAFAYSQMNGWKALVGGGQFVVGKVLDFTGTYGEDVSISKNGIPIVLEEGNYYLESDAMRSKPLNAELAEQQNVASSYLYVLTFAHLAHLAFGLLALLIMVVRSRLGRYTAKVHDGLWAGVIYWHFLAGLWVYLLLFLTFVH
ncbi:MAG: cytochrome c oxidase subunit 3 [Flavobacteriales bacterium]|nr:cytochrome c oxidase subunit 3 [Flavobacteriales bacterium]